MASVFFLLGTNMGDKRQNLAKGREAIAGIPVQIVQESGIYRTAAWGRTDQDEFYNQAIEIKTSLDPVGLMAVLLRIEEKLGRVRSEKWGARVIDIDILFYGDKVITESIVTVPHPRLHERRFALVPLNEIAADVIHPVLNKTVNKLLETCPDPLSVERIL